MESITESGLAIRDFDENLGAILGNTPGAEGARLLAQAAALKRSRVEVCDWLFCLAASPTTAVHKILVDDRGKTPKEFIEAVSGCLEYPSSSTASQPKKFTSAAASADVAKMLRDCHTRFGGIISEHTLTLSILDFQDANLHTALTLWAGSDGLQKFRRGLELQARPQQPPHSWIGSAGALNLASFSTSMRSFLSRVAEDAASIRAKRVTTRHVLYTLLGSDTNALCAVMSLNGFDVKKDLHSHLARELTRPGKKRLPDFRLTRETVLESVLHLFDKGQELATQDGVDKFSEHYLARAMIELYPEELTRLIPPSKVVDIGNIKQYLAEEEFDPEEELVSHQYSIEDIEREIKRRIIGQDLAIEHILPWIKRLRFGLTREGRPAGVFLFQGPTGTGKTQLAKELARFVFGNEEMLIFLEMGQFQTKESMSGLVGAPPGYVGYGEGLLTNGLRDKPEAVVLFDEIEKANQQVFHTLLRFADEGLISDPAGPIRDGRSCIIVMTTNAGQQWLREHLGEFEGQMSPDDLSEKLFSEAMKELKELNFRPEFLARVDEKVSFLPFDKTACRRIIDSVLSRELGKIETLKGIKFVVSEDVRDFLKDSMMARVLDEGARGAPRVVNQYIVTPAIDQLTRDGVPDSSLVGITLVATLLGTGAARRVVIERQ